MVRRLLLTILAVLVPSVFLVALQVWDKASRTELVQRVEEVRRAAPAPFNVEMSSTTAPPYTVFGTDTEESVREARVTRLIELDTAFSRAAVERVLRAEYDALNRFDSFAEHDRPTHVTVLVFREGEAGGSWTAKLSAGPDASPQVVFE